MQITSSLDAETIIYEKPETTLRDCVESAVKGGKSLAHADLCNADLLKAYLYKANLHRAEISNSNLRYVHLSMADLTGADLSQSHLFAANLRYANLVMANLCEADLVSADLSGATLRAADLRGAQLRGANLRDADLSAAKLHGADLSEADLRGANLTGTLIGKTHFNPGICLDGPLSKPPIQILGLKYFVLILDDHMKIGCEIHSLKDWFRFTSDEIDQMDGEAGLKFWMEWHESLRHMCAASGRETS